MVELTPELIKDLSKTRNGFYSWDYVAGLAVWIIGVEAENERLQVRVQELEQDLSDQSQKRLENAQVSTDRIIALEGKIRELEQERAGILVTLDEVVKEAYLQEPFSDDAGMNLLHGASLLLKKMLPQRQERG